MSFSTTLSGNGSGIVTNAAERAHQAVDRATETAAPVLGRAVDAAHRTIDRAAEVATPAASWVTENRRQLATRSSEMMDACGTYVRAHPVATVAGAVALGYLAARLLR